MVDSILPGMPSPGPATGDKVDGASDRRTGLYVLVIVIEAAVIAGLYWFGRHFV